MKSKILKGALGVLLNGQNGNPYSNNATPISNGGPCAPAITAFSQTTPGKQWALAPGLFVAISESYPEGNYKPVWPVTTNGQSVQMSVIDNVAGRYSMNTQQTLTVQIGDVGGRAVFIFNDGMRQCVADIPGLPVVLGPVPHTFSLGTFRSMNAQQGPCSAMSTNNRTYSGTISLAAAPSGDLTMGLDLRIFSDRNSLSYIYDVGGVAVKNAVTPAEARAQVIKDIRAAETAKVAAERQKSHAAQLAVREAQRSRNGGIVDPDEGSPVSAMSSVRHVSIIMRDINDEGALLIFHPDGSAEVTSHAQFHIVGGLGSVNDVIDEHLALGRNIVIFLLHHRHFILTGGGGWSFKAELLGDGKTIWGAQEADDPGDPVGIQYWKAFAIVRRPNGFFSISALPHELTHHQLARMVKFNEDTIDATRKDQQRQVGNLIGAFFGGNSKSSDSGLSSTDLSEMSIERREREQQSKQEQQQRDAPLPPPAPSMITGWSTTPQ